MYCLVTEKLLRLAPQGHFLRGVYGTFYLSPQGHFLRAPSVIFFMSSSIIYFLIKGFNFVLSLFRVFVIVFKFFHRKLKTCNKGTKSLSSLALTVKLLLSLKRL